MHLLMLAVCAALLHKTLRRGWHTTGGAWELKGSHGSHQSVASPACSSGLQHHQWQEEGPATKRSFSKPSHR